MTTYEHQPRPAKRPQSGYCLKCGMPKVFACGEDWCVNPLCELFLLIGKGWKQ